MLKLFLSRSTLKRLKKIKNFDWWMLIKRIIFVLIILLFIAFAVFFDFLFCGWNANQKDNEKNEGVDSSYSKIEEEVSLYEQKIIDIASFYNSNYDILTQSAKSHLSLEFDEITIEFDKNSDEKIIISAEDSNYNTVEFILKENKLEKIEDYNSEDSEDSEYGVIVLNVFVCVFTDLAIFLIGLLVTDCIVEHVYLW